MPRTTSDEFIDVELAEVRKKVETIPTLELIACAPVMVRIRYSRTKAKTLDICMQFPDNYPTDLVYVELKSKTLPEKFLDAVPKMVEGEKDKFVGEKQVLSVTRYCMQFLDTNPLCVCAQEIADLKKLIDENCGDRLKVKQKQTCLDVRIERRKYYFQVSIQVPENYPEDRIGLEIKETNYPEEFFKFFLGQGKEYARQCVEPPLTKNKNGPQPFTPQPSVYKVGSFMIKNAQRYPTEVCSICEKKCFPDNPEGVIEEEANDNYVDRIYCGHIFHHSCLNKHMSTPPFTGGKKCPDCGCVIYHEKWKSSEKTREERWAHEQAKQREFDEVADFLN